MIYPSLTDWKNATTEAWHGVYVPKAHYTSGLESLLEEYGRTPEPPKEPDYNSKEHRLAMAEEILFGEKPLEVLIGNSGGYPCWEHSRRRDAMSSLYDGGFVRIRP